MKRRIYECLVWCFTILVTGLNLYGCASTANNVALRQVPTASEKATTKETQAKVSSQGLEQNRPRPLRPMVKWAPSFKVRDISLEEASSRLPQMTVGARLSSQGGAVPLKEVLKKLAQLKGLAISWASDVDKDAFVEVDIRPKDDFWEALNNILRQQDYFYEFKKNTIVIKYKETRRFYVPVPFLTGEFDSNVGGDMLGSGEATSGMVKGTVSLQQSANQLDLWATIRHNLDKILNLAAIQAPSVTGSEVTHEREQAIREACRRQYPSRPAQQALCVDRAFAREGLSRTKATQSVQTTTSLRSREGFFYTIDKPLGIITVTAPRSIQEQVASYIEALKKELSKQVVIEAKILEVRLEQTHSMGIDWSSLLKDSKFNFNVLFGGEGGRIYPTKGIKLISNVNLSSKTFDLLLNALNEYGNVKVLSNPKLSLLNGQPAMLTVGESVKYIDSVESTVDSETGIITYTVNTQSILSGLGFSVMAQISGDDSVVLHITPVTSKLQEPIEYKSFGGETGSQVGLPRVTVREMTTMAKVKNGEFLIIGGLIDEIKDKQENKVPILGDVPVVGHAFRSTRVLSNKRELIILLRPRVL